jgi:hypothetical protein
LKIVNNFKFLFRYGVTAGSIVPPEDCQLAEGTCDVIFVKTSDSSQPCYDSESSDST